MEQFRNFKGVVFYPEDFLFAVRNWDDEAVGEYIKLLCEQAVSGGYLEGEFFRKNCGDQLVQKKFLYDKETDSYYNARMLQETEKARLKSEKARTAASKRWNKTDANAAANADAKGDTNNISSSNSTLGYSSEVRKGDYKGKRKEIKKTEPLIYPWTDELFLNRWQIFKDYKKEQHRFTYKSVKTEQAALLKLSKLSGGNMADALEILENSIANGWQGLFALDKRQQAQERSAAAKPAYDELVRMADESLKAKKK